VTDEPIVLSRFIVEEERSSVLVNSKMGRSSGIWGVRVNQKVGERSQKSRTGVE
jgi:hypothetical protein